MGEFPNKDTQWKPGQSGNPAGKPKGAIHIATRIQNMLNDENFVQKLKDGNSIKGAPADIMIKAAIASAVSGDMRALDILLKHGWGSKQVHEFEGSPVDKILEKYGLKETESGEKENNDDRQAEST